MIPFEYGPRFRTLVADRVDRARSLPLLVLAALAALAALSALPGPPVAAAAQAEQRVRLDQITDNPATFYGVPVAVAGEVDMVLSPRVFSIEDDDVLFDDDILVITREPLPPVAGRWGDAEVLEDDIVLVFGTVRPLDLAAIEQEIGADLDDDLFVYWTGTSAIVASAVVLTPRKPGPLDASVEDVVEDPAEFYGLSLALRGEVEDILGERAFVLEQDDAELLVVTARPVALLDPRLAGSQLDEDDLVDVRGPVRPFDLAAFERDVGADLDSDELAASERRPALIARWLRLVE
ncbi:MAG: hypothetical protein M3O34_04020 [Chloroflexota bacterium]|nr:hypothetical protein [Chloroflexota bacterium]